MCKYSIGIDFGTMSARCVLANLSTGKEDATSEFVYPHGVLTDSLPDGTPLSTGWALQDPKDYIDALSFLPKDVIKKSNVDPKNIIGVGADFTGCTVLPIKKDGTPLCMLEKYKSEPNAYVKLWKQHSAQPEADDINRIALERGEPFLKRYGGKISSEWLFPKLWQILKQAPQVYDNMDYFVEACDWITYLLCGRLVRSSCAAGYKAMWSKHDGFPSADFFKALDYRLENVVKTKLNTPIQAIGTKAGEITKNASELTGLAEGTAVAVGFLDAHVAAIGAGAITPGQMMIVMGTSACDMLISKSGKEVPGICGVCEDGIIPGYFGYESGQSCSGDHYQWFIKNCVPAEYFKEAKREGVSIYRYLDEKVQDELPGESRLIALDWWNGNRSVLMDAKLSGLMLGCTLSTKPEEVYRALVEATAFGTRKILETYEKSNVPVNELHIVGGIAKKDPFVMQIYADITNKQIHVADSPQIPALSSSMWGAIAAGREKGGFSGVNEAVSIMVRVGDSIIYKPNPKNKEAYDLMFSEYEKLHDYFGCGGNNVMKTMLALSEKKKKKKRKR